MGSFSLKEKLREYKRLKLDITLKIGKTTGQRHVDKLKFQNLFLYLW